MKLAGGKRGERKAFTKDTEKNKRLTRRAA